VDRSALAYVDLDGTVARRVAKQAGRVVAEWRTTAIAAGIKKTELDRMASAFEHKDLAMAVEGAGTASTIGGSTYEESPPGKSSFVVGNRPPARPHSFAACFSMCVSERTAKSLRRGTLRHGL
jgi:hypothetical protein